MSLKQRMREMLGYASLTQPTRAQIGKRGLINIFIGFIIVFIIAIIFGKVPIMGGEMYTKEGEALGAEITKELINQGFCKTNHECNQVLEIYAAHGNRVNFSIYGPKNKSALATVIKLIVERGIQLTSGIPISVRVFPKSRNEYGDIFLEPKSIIRLEID